MATWKKVVVSGSGLEQLSNATTQYITATSLPTVNDSTITIRTGSISDSDTFTLNQASDKTINVFSGQYSDLAGTPSIPTVNDNRITIRTGSISDSADFTLNQASDATINVFSGQYEDLAGTPSIPAPANDSTITIQTGSISDSDTFTLDQASNKTINVFSGQYSDLAGTPSIPTVNDSTITIQTGSISDSDTFTLNQASGKTINVFSGQYSDLEGAPADFVTSVSSTTGQTGITLGVSGGVLSATAAGLGTTDNVEFANLTVSGDLEVAGTASFKHSSNLNVADQYISMNSGSSGAGLDSGGIVVLQDGASGELFGWADGSNDQRWGVLTNFNPGTTGDFAPTAYMSAVLKPAAANTAAGILTAGGGTADAGYNRDGNIYTSTADDSIWIYS